MPRSRRITLKGGARTSDPRLDRVVQFDDRSRKFSVVRAVAPHEVRTPRSRTWKLSLEELLNQLQEGGCVSMGWVHDAKATPQAVLAATIAGAKVPLDFDFAIKRVYHEAQRIDEWPGGSYPGARPRYEGTSVLAGAQVMQKLGFFQEYRWAFTLEEVLAAIGYVGPVVLGLVWYSGMFDPDADGFIHPTGVVEGGHCVAATMLKIVFRKGAAKTFANVDLDASWIGGPQSWGLDHGGWPGFPGFWRMTLREFDRVRREDGEVCVPFKRRTKVILAA